MENDNTLFGFEAISDMLLENGNTNRKNTSLIDTDNDEDLSDDELERLKQDSVNNRPNTPGSKNSKNTDDVVESDEDESDLDDDEDDDDNQDKSTINKENKKSDNHKDETEEDDELDETETAKVTALFDAIAEELDWEFTEDEKDDKPKTVEDLVNYFKDMIKEQSVPQYASDEVAKLDEFVRNGGDINKYFTVTPDIDYDNFDVTIESNQKQIVKMLLVEKGYNEKQIERKLEKYEDAGILEDEAEDALESMKEIEEAKKEKLLIEQKRENERRLQNQRAFVDDVVHEITAMDDVRGIKIPEKDKKALLQYIFKADANGKTQYQKDYSKSVKNLIESAYFTMKGDALLENAKKVGSNSAIKNLKQSLRSTGVSKGNRRINTTSSDSMFSKLAQLL